MAALRLHRDPWGSGLVRDPPAASADDDDACPTPHLHAALADCYATAHLHGAALSNCNAAAHPQISGPADNNAGLDLQAAAHAASSLFFIPSHSSPPASDFVPPPTLKLDGTNDSHLDLVLEIDEDRAALKKQASHSLLRTRSPASVLSVKLGTGSAFPFSRLSDKLGSKATLASASSAPSASPSGSSSASSFALHAKCAAAMLLPAPADVPARESPESNVDRNWRAYVREHISEKQLNALARIGATDPFGAPLETVVLPNELVPLFSPGTRAAMAAFGITKEL